jgi:1-acyl-sn-glycerol-3-phosphate acyltransferase
MTIPVPPRWVRRLVIDPVFWGVGIWLLLAALPLVLILAAVLSFVLPGKLRVLRLLGFALVYLTIEIVALTAALCSWVASGFGWAIDRPAFVEFHYRLVRRLLSVLYWFGSRYFALVVDRRGPQLPGDDGDPETVELPLLVLSRHAGPGDSFLLVHELLSWGDRRPRVVLKHTLQWDPMLDVVLNRLPMAFVDPTSDLQQGVVDAIGQLAATMVGRDALLIFPEGGNVTPRRRQRAIERLRRSGREGAARRAEGIVNLLPPRPRGVQAALRANPALQVVVVAHTGLDDLNTVGDLWQAIPVDKTLHLRWHAVPAADVPTDERGLSDWLFTEWEDMDAWVTAHRADPIGEAL